MADDAIKVLQQAIDTARTEGRAEGYAEGFAVAMRMIQEFSASASAPEGSEPRPTIKVRPRPGSQPSVPKGRLKVSDAPYAPRVAGQLADSLVERAYQSISPRAAGPTEIQHIVMQQKGTDLPGTSVKRAIDRLTAQHKLRQISGTKTWVYGSGETDSSAEGAEAEASGGSVPSRRAISGNGAAPKHP
jgi:hypothetical protein